MKKFWLIPLFIFGLSITCQAQTITSFYGTETSFNPNVYSDIVGYSVQWNNNTIGTETETFSTAFVTRGFDNKSFQLNYGSASGCVGTITFYSKVGATGTWSTNYVHSVTGTGSTVIKIEEFDTLERIGIRGTMTLDANGEIYTKKRP